MRPVIVDGVRYPSLTSAAEAYGISGQQATNRIKSKNTFENWQYEIPHAEYLKVKAENIAKKKQARQERRRIAADVYQEKQRMKEKEKEKKKEEVALLNELLKNKPVVKKEVVKRGRPKLEESKKKEATKREPIIAGGAWKIPVIIEGIHYDSFCAAERAFGVTRQCVKERILSENIKWKDWKYEINHDELQRHYAEKRAEKEQGKIVKEQAKADHQKKLTQEKKEKLEQKRIAAEERRAIKKKLNALNIEQKEQLIREDGSLYVLTYERREIKPESGRYEYHLIDMSLNEYFD